MIKIGLTGSIGMGKSTTAKMFVDAGIPVFDADVIVHQLYSKGGMAIEPISQQFQNVIIDGAVDRGLLAKHLINNPQGYKDLEKIVHPLVAESRQQWVQRQQNNKQAIVLFDIPLLLENKGEKNVDLVIVVTAPAEIQRQRVLARDGMSEEKFDKILKRQMPDKEKHHFADYIINTQSGLENARLQVEAILRHIRQR